MDRNHAHLLNFSEVLNTENSIVLFWICKIHLICDFEGVACFYLNFYFDFVWNSKKKESEGGGVSGEIWNILKVRFADSNF